MFSSTSSDLGYNSQTMPSIHGDNSLVKEPTSFSIKAWNSRLEELKQYKTKHGHCLVPYRDASTGDKASPLGSWVSRQRQQYRLRREGKPSQMSDERIKQLEDIGFEWYLREKPRGLMVWGELFQQLRNYKDKHGDCLVPLEDSNYSALAEWVEHQRHEYELRQQGKESSLTDENIAALEELGFDWKAKQTTIRKRRPWDEWLEDLRRYKDDHGDCLVPFRSGKNSGYASLGRWVNSQRRQYKRRMDGKKSSMTDERIKALEQLGFVWSMRIREARVMDWNDWLDELNRYKDEHGDCNVSFRYGPLGSWVARQRQHFARRSAGCTSPLTDEKIADLEMLGFEWVKKGQTEVQRKSLNQSKSMTWNDSLDELKEYKAANGHCRPGRETGDDSLADWVNQQRYQYHLWREGKKSSMSADR